MSPLPTLEALSGSRILMLLSLKLASGQDAEAFQRLPEHVQRQRRAQFQALQLAALAVVRSGESCRWSASAPRPGAHVVGTKLLKS
jgi:hypothetical protein